MEAKQILNITTALEFLRQDVDFSREQVVLIGVNAKNIIIFNKIIFLGGINQCIIDLRIIFRELILQSCNGFILGHNHPSGDLTPSKEDLRVYDIICRVSDDLGFSFLDNVIFSETKFYSFFEEEK